jgi:hypothetical protein
MSLLELTFVCLCQFLPLNACTFLRRMLGTHATARGESPYLKMRRGGRPIVPVMNGCKHGGKGPPESESSGGGDEEEDEDGEEGVVTPPLHSTPREDLPSLSDLFSQQAGISVGGRRPKRPWIGTGHHPSRCHSPVLCWYLLTYRG